MSSINKFKLQQEAFQNLVDIKFYVRVKRGIPSLVNYGPGIYFVISCLSHECIMDRPIS